MRTTVFLVVLLLTACPGRDVTPPQGPYGYCADVRTFGVPDEQEGGVWAWRECESDQVDTGGDLECEDGMRCCRSGVSGACTEEGSVGRCTPEEVTIGGQPGGAVLDRMACEECREIAMRAEQPFDGDC